MHRIACIALLGLNLPCRVSRCLPCHSVTSLTILRHVSPALPNRAQRYRNPSRLVVPAMLNRVLPCQTSRGLPCIAPTRRSRPIGAVPLAALPAKHYLARTRLNAPNDAQRGLLCCRFSFREKLLFQVFNLNDDAINFRRRQIAEHGRAACQSDQHHGYSIRLIDHDLLRLFIPRP